MASNVAQGSTRLILIGSAMLLSIGMGLRQSLGLFLTPVTRDLALTAADFTLTIAIQNIVWGLSQAPVGAIADRFGLRVTLVAGTVIGGAPFTESRGRCRSLDFCAIGRNERDRLGDTQRRGPPRRLGCAPKLNQKSAR
jgi:MFS family permease